MTRGRRAVSKKTRFEVFKRDSFTCQYCGRKAPDVVLHADHIEPVAEGGTNDLLNLTTSCADCNSGKGKRRLSDSSVVEKQRAALDDLQERQDQIQMLMEWQRSLLNIEADTVQQLVDFWCELADWFGVTPEAVARLTRIVKRNGAEKVVEAMRESATAYFQFGDDGKPTDESSNVAFGKIEAIIRVNQAVEKEPYLRDVYYIRGIIRKRFDYIDYGHAKDILTWAMRVGAETDHLYHMARRATSWTAWRTEMYELLDELDPPEGNDA